MVVLGLYVFDRYIFDLIYFSYIGIVNKLTNIHKPDFQNWEHIKVGYFSLLKLLGGFNKQEHT